MTLWQGSRVHLAAAITAAVGIPFYLGLVHTPIVQLALYSGVAGTAMAAGDFAENPGVQRAGLRLFFADVMVWATVVGLLGSLAYVLALIF